MSRGRLQGLARGLLPAGKFNWFIVPAIIFLLAFFIVPVAQLLRLSFLGRNNEYSIGHYHRLLTEPYYVDTILNTFWISLWATLVTLILAYPVAYLMSRVDGIKRTILVGIVLIPFWTSILVRTFAWMIVLGRNGVINSTAKSLGIELGNLSLIYNLFSVLVSMTHALLPVAVMTMYAVMVNIDRNLERAAATLGARGAHSFWRIYFPLSFPGVATAGLVVFITAIGFFVQPALLGGRQETMVAQAIIFQIDEALNWGFAGAIAVLLLVFSAGVIIVFDRLFGLSSVSGAAASAPVRSNSGGRRRLSGVGRRCLAVLGWIFAAIGEGRDRLIGGKRRRNVGGQRFSALSVVAGLILFLALAPSFFLIPISFSESASFQWPPRGFTTRWYEAYLASPAWQQATIRSLWVGACTAVLSIVLGAPAAFALVRTAHRYGSATLTYFLLPLIVPNIIVALALFYFFSRLGWVGSSSALIIGHTILALPYVILTIMATLKNYDRRLDDAAATLGASTWQTMRRITFPIVKIGMISAFLFGFVKSFDELTVALFVAGGLTNTLPKQMWADAHYNISPILAAVSTITLLGIVLILFLTEYLSFRARQRIG